MPKRQHIAGFTPLEKYQLCKLREKFPKIKLSEFALLEECPKRPDGRPLAVSSLSDHLKGWEKKSKENPPTGPTAQKKKSRTAQYPFFEHFLALWIDAAESERIPVTDDIIRSQAKIIQQELIQAGVSEIYEGFELSGGWLFNFKGRYNIGRLKLHGEAGQVDEKVLPIQRQRIAEQLISFAPCDRYNCDESGLIYNKQPQSSNVRKEKGKSLSGKKDSKTRISTFHIVNSDGTDKRKLWVIARAKEPRVFKNNRVNTANLPVIYRYNRKAWMLTGLWYEFLRTFNHQMHIERRHIALITDNCPTHPHPLKPPQNYAGPIPPELTNITLIYLPPNTTSHLQPLDQGIIKAFKAAYRRQYADSMVQHFNKHGVAPEKIDILQAVHLISDAWDAITSTTIVNCWKKAGICGDYEEQSPNTSGPTPDDQLQHFLALQKTHCQIAMRQIFDPLSSFQTPDPDWEPSFNEFFSFDEDSINEDLKDNEESALPDASQIVRAGIAAGVLFRGASQLDNYDDDPDTDTDTLSSLITIDGAIHYATELSRYLQSMCITELYTSGGKVLSLSDMVSKTSHLCTALTRQAHSPNLLNFSLIYYSSYKQTSHTHQTKISSFFTADKRLGAAEIPSEPGPSIITRPQALRNSPPLRFSYTSSDGEEDERDLTCMPTEWSTGRGIREAYQRLLE